MKSFLASFQWFTLLSLTISSSTSASAALEIHIPRLRVPDETIIQDSKSNVDEFKTIYNYSQTLDHFNYRPESYTTFNQSYMIDTKYWGITGRNNAIPPPPAPILAYLGAEGALNFTNIGYLTKFAQPLYDKFQEVLLVYIEHRYYGQSMPFGSMEEAYKNASTRAYFNSAQAIADYAAILMHVKKEFNAEYSPVIVVGGSYGGMVASWIRLKYPHVVLGALASSAPVLFFDDIMPHDTYYSIVAKDYWDVSEHCHDTIMISWGEITKFGYDSNGLSFLSEKFDTCKPLTSASELTSALMSTYIYAAQYDIPPRYPDTRSPVGKICHGIDNPPPGEDDILGRIHAGLVAYRGNGCYGTTSSTTNLNTINSCIPGTDGWAWQRCSEMVMPFSHENVPMFPKAVFNLTSFMISCESKCGVRPRPNWVTTYYGGHDIELILHRFGSNIIFSNGLRDPYSGVGVLKNISDSIVALTTNLGSHCLDIASAHPDDPDWLVEQREKEIEIINGWIETYHKDLLARKGGPRLFSASHGSRLAWGEV